MAKLGAKTAARRLAEGAGVPVVPGAIPDDQSDTAIAAAATRVGFPVLLKPSEGGGGIGMKEVHAAADLPAAIAQARREADAAFGDGTLYVERLVTKPRHVEFQIIGDRHGTVVHLFERECSIQRRHQKVLEETPSTAVTPALRARMGAAAVALAKAAGYANAGTVEFLVDGQGDTARFYFLEMNARLQVEHPITESVTGVDLVRAQIEVAAGMPVPWTQEQLTQRGHAIEVRVCAEDPRQGFLPQAGVLALYREPSMPGIRVDSGVSEGAEVSVHYDSLLAKLVAWGETREAARQRARAALAQYPILGIRTNVPLLMRLLAHERFVAGDLDTHFLQTEAAALIPAGEAPSADARAVAALVRRGAGGAPAAGGVDTSSSDPWTSLGKRHV
jgi:acetyl/propionyl-CoA carboxylase alpha subunit